MTARLKFRFRYASWANATVTVRARDYFEAVEKACATLDARYEEAGQEPPVAWTLALEAAEPPKSKEAAGARRRLPTMPPVLDRRPLDEDDPDGYQESDRDWFENNRDAVLWFLDNHREVRLAVEMLT